MEPLSHSRRATKRHPCDYLTYCQPGAGQVDQTYWFARVRNISTEGIGLYLWCRFDPGTILAVELSSPNRVFSRTMHARVVHATRNGDKGWLIGCALVEKISDTDLQALL